jgi:hypothetical protein
MKKCSKCAIEKELDDFPKNKNRIDGRAPACSACQSAYKKEHSYKGYSKGYNAGVASVKKEMKLIIEALRHVLVEQYLEEEEKIGECIESFNDYINAHQASDPIQEGMATQEP